MPWEIYIIRCQEKNLNLNECSNLGSGSNFSLVMYCIVLKGWSLVPNALRPFQHLLCSPEFRYN